MREVLMLQLQSSLQINWVDTFDNEDGYQVERRVGDRSLADRGIAAASVDNGTSMWVRPVMESAYPYRVVATVDGRLFPAAFDRRRKPRSTSI